MTVSLTMSPARLTPAALVSAVMFSISTALERQDDKTGDVQQQPDTAHAALESIPLVSPWSRWRWRWCS